MKHTAPRAPARRLSLLLALLLCALLPGGVGLADSLTDFYLILSGGTPGGTVNGQAVLTAISATDTFVLADYTPSHTNADLAFLGWFHVVGNTPVDFLASTDSITVGTAGETNAEMAVAAWMGLNASPVVLDFGVALVGYTDITPQIFSIFVPRDANVVSNVQITLSGDGENGYAFDTDRGYADATQYGGQYDPSQYNEAQASIRPRNGLPAGSYAATATVTTDASSALTVERTFTFVVHNITADAVSLGGVLAGSAATPQPVTITNHGPVAAVIDSITSGSGSVAVTSGDGALAGNGTNSSFTVAPAADLAPGPYADTLTISLEGGKLSIPVQVTFTVEAALTLDSIDLGTLDDGYVPAPQAFAIANSGPNAATITSAALRTGTAFSLLPGADATVPGQGTNSGYAIQPIDGLAPNTYTDTLDIQYSLASGAAGTLSVPVSLTVAPTYGVTADAVSFGTAVMDDPLPAAQAITVRNNGPRDVVIDSIVPGNPLWYDIVPGASATVSAQGTNTAFTIQPVAGLLPGTYDDVLTLSLDGGAHRITTNVAYTVVAGSTVPDAVTGLATVSGDGQISLSWRAPASNGGSAILYYEVSSDNGSTWTSTQSTGTAFTVTGLRNGTAYTLAVRAVNGKGEGPLATTSAIPGVAAGQPSQPQGFAAIPGDGQVSLSWQAPASDGGSPVTGYLVSMDGGATWTPSDSLSGHTFQGLTNGVRYTFLVRAGNATGHGLAATGSAVPQAPAPFAALTAAPEAVSFGSAQLAGMHPAPQTITLTNAGTLPVTLESLSVSGSAAFEATMALPVTLQPGQRATATVSVAEGSLADAGDQSATVTLAYTAASGARSLSIPVSFQVIAHAGGGLGQHTMNLADGSDDGFVRSMGAATLYSGPGIEYAVVGTAGAGASYAVMDVSADRLWLHVRLHDGMEGWLHLPYAGGW